MQNLEIKGEWWLPEKPSNKISGALTMTPEESPTLELHGSFRESKDPINSSETELKKIDIVCGDSVNGKEITLQGCHITGERSSINFESGKEHIITKIWIEKIFLNHHFLEEPKLKELTVEFPYLSNWMNKRTFSVSLESEKRTIIDFNDWSKECSIETVEVLFYIGNGGHQSFEEYSTYKCAFVKIKSRNEIPYTQLAKYLWGINNFFNFATGKDTFQCKIKGSIETADKELKDQGVLKDIEIFFQAKNDYQGKDSAVVQLMPLPLELIEANFEEVLKKWFEKRKSLEWVFNLYFSYRRNKNSYLNDEFLAIVRALEVYYNCVVKGTYLPENDYKQKVKEPLIKVIKSLNNIDSGLKDSLKNKLKWGNEKSLYNKLKFLYKKKEDSCKQLRISEELLEKIRNTRNHFTHYTEDENNILSNEETVKTTIKLKAMLELFILEEIGLNEAEKRFVNYNMTTYKPCFND